MKQKRHCHEVGRLELLHELMRWWHQATQPHHCGLELKSQNWSENVLKTKMIMRMKVNRKGWTLNRMLNRQLSKRNRTPPFWLGFSSKRRMSLWAKGQVQGLNWCSMWQYVRACSGTSSASPQLHRVNCKVLGSFIPSQPKSYHVLSSYVVFQITSTLYSS